MGKIVAIGGGEIGRPGTKVETLEIDLEIMRLSGKQKPKLLFIPTATDDSDVYCGVVKMHFSEILHCDVDCLYLLENRLTKKKIAEKILKSDIIYVGGGDTLKMLKEWRRQGVDDILLRAYKKGVVLSGLSAGAICWFRYGGSSLKQHKNPDAGLTKINGLNLINALLCPHYNSREHRGGDLKALMSKTTGIALALDDCCAIECVDGKYRIITSKNTANAYKLYWRDGKYYEEIIKKTKTYLPLKNLLTI